MLKWCIKHLQIVQKNSFKEQLPKAYFNLGVAYQSMDQYDKSLEAFKASLSSGKTSGNKKLDANANLHISAIYKVQGNLTMAKKYQNNSFDLLAQIDFENLTNRQMADSQANLGILLVKQKKYSPAKAAYLNAIKFYDRLRDKQNMIIVMNSIGILEEAIAQNDSASSYYRKGIAIAASIGDSSAAVSLFINYGNFLTRLGKFSDAKILLNKGISLAGKSGSTDEQIRGMQLMSELLYKQGNYREAFNYLSRSTRFFDSISGIRNQQSVAALGAKYDMELKEAKLQNNHQESFSKLFSFMQSSTGIYFLVILAIIVGILPAIYYLRNKNKDKDKDKDKDRDKIAGLLNEKNREIEKLEDELKVLNVTKDKFFSVIANDLRNPFTAVLGFADILKEDYENIDEKDKILYIRAIHSSSFNIYELLKNLLDWSRTQTGTLECKPTLIDMSQLTEQNVQLFASYAHNKDIQLGFEILGEAVTYADRSMVSTVIRNLLNNAIKFTNKGGEVYVTVKDVDNMSEFSVTDTGTGIAESDLEKLFQLGHSNRSKGTADESGTGLGLILCKEFISMNKGTIRAESAPGKGSRFTISLPVRSPESVQ